MKILIAIALCAALSAHAQAQLSLNKCVDADGRITYQSVPCGSSGTAVRNWDRQTREQELEAENRMLREELNKRQAHDAYQPPPQAVGRTRNDLRAERANSQECQQATRSYQIEASSLSKTYGSVQAKRRAMDAACGMGF